MCISLPVLYQALNLVGLCHPSRTGLCGGRQFCEWGRGIFEWGWMDRKVDLVQKEAGLAIAP